MKTYLILCLVITIPLGILAQNKELKNNYPIVGTGQVVCYDDRGEISLLKEGMPYWGQDACYKKNESKYRDNNDGTITDLVTGLVWEKDMGAKMTFEEAQKKANELRKGGYDDWRVPTIKELYSLIQFTGQAMGEKSVRPFIDAKYFDQPTGNRSAGEREIDAQTWSSTIYNGSVMGGQKAAFGVNFVDGRIKGYPLTKRGEPNKMFFRLVRGNSDYGKNNLVDNGDGTVTDFATGLMWQKEDNGKLYDWQEALKYAEALTLGGYDDWHLPDAKELHSIVDYDRSPSTTNSAAISPLFSISQIKYEKNVVDYPFFWSSTTHLDGPTPARRAVYFCFGTGFGKSPRNDELIDVHGAGAQRSDPKSGNKNDYPQFFGPQQDILCVYNAVRCVRRIAD